MRAIRAYPVPFLQKPKAYSTITMSHDYSVDNPPLLFAGLQDIID
jgi:hypothetical protein